MNLKRSLIFLASGAMIASVGFELVKSARADENPISYPNTYPTVTVTLTPTVTPSTTPVPTASVTPTPTSQKYTISGTIKMKVFNRYLKRSNSTAVDPSGIKVVFTNRSNYQTFETTTDSNGNFSIELADGKYSAQAVRKNTFFAPAVRVVVVNHAKANADFNGFAY
jgi:hypothetical protein